MRQKREQVVVGLLRHFDQRLEEIEKLEWAVAELERMRSSMLEQVAQKKEEVRRLSGHSYEHFVGDGTKPSKSEPSMVHWILRALSHYKTSRSASHTNVEAIRIYINSRDESVLATFGQNTLHTAIAKCKRRGLIVTKEMSASTNREYDVTPAGESYLRQLQGVKA